MASRILARRLFLLRRAQARRQPADRLQNVDGRIMPRRAQFARQNDVAVQNSAHRVANRLVEIVPFHQHREKSGDRALAKLPARSKIFGSKLNTDGVYPFWLGGSPAASPISRCAMASRVTESITSSTSAP